MYRSERASPVQPIQLVSLRDHVHVQLREAIVAGRFGEGERINERELAKDFGISTTPLKEALRRLEAEGLVRTEARRGVFVTFGPKQAEEMSLARAAIESMIARLAAKRASAAVIKTLQAHVAEMEVATRNGDAERLIELNELFHTQIHEASGCDYLRRLQNSHQMYTRAARVLLLQDTDERNRALAEHAAILEAIVKADQDAAERVMRDHVMRSGQQHIARFLNARPSGEAA
jgi:DNA-binding GntR family transcriptional regulator